MALISCEWAEPPGLAPPPPALPRKGAVRRLMASPETGLRVMRGVTQPGGGCDFAMVVVLQDGELFTTIAILRMPSERPACLGDSLARWRWHISEERRQAQPEQFIDGQPGHAGPFGHRAAAGPARQARPCWAVWTPGRRRASAP